MKYVSKIDGTLIEKDIGALWFYGAENESKKIIGFGPLQLIFSGLNRKFFATKNFSPKVCAEIYHFWYH